MNKLTSEQTEKKTCLLQTDQNQPIRQQFQTSATNPPNTSKFLKPGVAVFIALILILGFWIGMLCNTQSRDISVLSYDLSDASQNQQEISSANSFTKSSSSRKSSSSKSSKEKSSSSSSSKAKKDNPSSSSSSEPESESSVPEVIPPDAVGNTPSNILNGGFLAVHDGWIYSSGIDSTHCLYKQQSADDCPQKITNKSASCIGIVGNMLYARLGGADYQLTQMDLDGNVSQQWVIGNDSINVFADHIITSDAYGIYMINSDNISMQIYAGRISQCCAYDGLVYFIEDGNLYHIDESGNDLTLDAENVQQYSIGEDGLYYISQNTLFCADTDELVENIPHICSLNIYNGTIYFGNLDDGAKLYSVPVSGGTPCKLSDQPAKAICVMDGVIAVKWGDKVTFVE